MSTICEQPRRVAILKPCCIGDCIMALPAVDAIANAWSAAELDVFVGHHSRVAFGFRPSLRTRPIPESFSLSGTMQLSRRLRQGNYDAIVVLDRSRWLRLAARLSRSDSSAMVRSMSPEIRHESEVYLDVVREIGIPTPESTPRIVPDPDTTARAASLVGDARRPIALLHPGGAQNPGVAMLDKRWPATRFVQLATLLQRGGVDVFVSGGPGDVNVARFVAEQSGVPESHMLAGKIDIETLTAVLRLAAVYVGPDTGVSHIAAAVGAPTIAIFGPTNPRRYRPLGRHVRVLAPPESWQIPDRDLRRNPTARPAITTERVTLEAVVDACREALSHGDGFSR